MHWIQITVILSSAAQFKTLKEKQVFMTNTWALWFNDVEFKIVLKFCIHMLEMKSLPVLQILLITFKAIHGLAPVYLSEIITHKNTCTYILWSAGEILLQPPRIKTLRTIGNRSVTAAAPARWNNLPNVIRSATSVDSFKKRLKIHLLKIAFVLI